MLSAILDIFFPAYCSGCRRLGTYVCLTCQKTIQYMYFDVCVACGKPSHAGLTHRLCRSSIAVAQAIVVYSDLIKAILRDSKYRGSPRVLEEFINILEPALYEHVMALSKLYPDMIVQSIPLHPVRLRARGYNQSDHIARRICRIARLQSVNVLKRVHYHATQSRLPHDSSRARNVSGAFEVTDPSQIAGKNILLVDDVVTTGATVGEAARVLRQAGAASVIVLSLAKG